MRYFKKKQEESIQPVVCLCLNAFFSYPCLTQPHMQSTNLYQSYVLQRENGRTVFESVKRRSSDSLIIRKSFPVLDVFNGLCVRTELRESIT